MIKFIGHTQNFKDVSPVQEGLIENLTPEFGGMVHVRVCDEDGDTSFCKVALRKVIVAWK